jgi:hypothetical protein
MAQMATVAWLSLAFVLVVVIVGLITTILRTIHTWRAFRSLKDALGGRLDDILRKTADMEARLAGAGERAARLEEALERLQRSRTRAMVLATAFGEVRASVGRVTGVVPKK